MKRLLILALAMTVLACGGGDRKPAGPAISKNPASVRGWIVDVEGSGEGTLRTPETESARLTQIFQATNIWVENAPYVSGGVAENGAFILLDVPPGKVVVSFNAPGAETAQIVMENIPGNADVLVPAVILKKTGSTITKPEGIQVRIPARIDAPRPTGAKATVGGHIVNVMEAPLKAFVDRRDYPDPGGLRPVATYK